MVIKKNTSYFAKGFIISSIIFLSSTTTVFANYLLPSMVRLSAEGKQALTTANTLRAQNHGLITEKRELAKKISPNAILLRADRDRIQRRIDRLKCNMANQNPACRQAVIDLNTQDLALAKASQALYQHPAFVAADTKYIANLKRIENLLETAKDHSASVAVPCPAGQERSGSTLLSLKKIAVNRVEQYDFVNNNSNKRMPGACVAAKDARIKELQELRSQAKACSVSAVDELRAAVSSRVKCEKNGVAPNQCAAFRAQRAELSKQWQSIQPNTSTDCESRKGVNAAIQTTLANNGCSCNEIRNRIRAINQEILSRSIQCPQGYVPYGTAYAKSQWFHYNIKTGATTFVAGYRQQHNPNIVMGRARGNQTLTQQKCQRISNLSTKKASSTHRKKAAKTAK